MVVMALMVAINIVLVRFLSIPMATIRIDIGFLPIAVTAMMFGPISAAIVGVMADIIGVTFFSPFTMFPGFTLSAFLIGMVYGFLIHKHKRNNFTTILAVLIVTIIIQLGLDTLWVHMITGNPYTALLPLRAIRTAVMIPVQFILIKSIAHAFKALKVI